MIGAEYGLVLDLMGKESLSDVLPVPTPRMHYAWIDRLAINLEFELALPEWLGGSKGFRIDNRCGRFSEISQIWHMSRFDDISQRGDVDICRRKKISAQKGALNLYQIPV